MSFLCPTGQNMATLRRKQPYAHPEDEMVKLLLYQRKMIIREVLTAFAWEDIPNFVKFPKFHKSHCPMIQSLQSSPSYTCKTGKNQLPKFARNWIKHESTSDCLAPCPYFLPMKQYCFSHFFLLINWMCVCIYVYLSQHFYVLRENIQLRVYCL